jgi:uncharacterized protein
MRYDVALMSEHHCPICNKPAEMDRTVNPYSPFCTRRCKTIDLGRWLGEGYRIPVQDQEIEDDPGTVPPRREGENE